MREQKRNEWVREYLTSLFMEVTFTVEIRFRGKRNYLRKMPQGVVDLWQWERPGSLPRSSLLCITCRIRH